MVSVFFSLPDHLKISLLDEWLALPNTKWASVDRVGDDLFTAVELCRRYRKELSELLDSQECIFQCHVDDMDGDKLPMIVKHDMKVRRLTLYRYNYEAMESGSAVLRFLSPYLRHLIFNLVSESDLDNNAYTGPSEYDAFGEDGNNRYDHGYDYAGGDSILLEIFDACPLLEHFEVERVAGVMILSARLHDSFCALFTKCANLQSVLLNQCKNISAAIAQAMCAAPNLKHISLSLFTTFAPDAFDRVTSGCTVNSPVREIEAPCAQFCALFPQLDKVDMFQQTSAQAITLARSCPHLTSATLGLSDTMSISEATQLGTYWHDVRHLAFNSGGGDHEAVTAEAVQALITQLRSLHTFCSSSYFERSTVPECTYPLHYQGSRLREVHLTCATHELLNTIVHVCPYLHTLYLSCAYRAPALVEKKLLDSLHLLKSSSARYLCMEGYTALSDAHISTLSTLETLRLTRVASKTLTNTGIVSMARNSTTLRELHVQSVSNVTANVGLDVVQACPTLHAYTYAATVFSAPENTNAMYMDMVRTLLRVAYPHVRKFTIDVRYLNVNK